MGRIEKYPLERMKDKEIKLSFDCPHCVGSRIEMNNEEDISFWKGVECPKCKALILLDDLSVTVVSEGARTTRGRQKQTPSHP